MRNFDAKITEWRSRMAAGGIKSPAVLDELESHLREDVERELRTGSDESAAFENAVKRMGRSDLLKAEFAKIKRSREIPLGRVVGIACCVTAILYSMILAPSLVTIRELDSAQRILGLGAVFLTLLFGASLGFGYKYLPVIRNRRARIASVSACALGAFMWLSVFSNLLPNVIVTRLIAGIDTEKHPIMHSVSGGFESQAGSLQIHNRVSLSDDHRVEQSGPGLNAVFNIGISLFWAMTLAAALGGLAYGLEEAAARREAKTEAYV